MSGCTIAATVAKRTCGVVHVLGYYGSHLNWGDVVFQHVLRSLLVDRYGLSMSQVLINDLDHAHRLDFSTAELVLIGGGDLFMNYFARNIEHVRQVYHGPIVFVGVGISFPSSVKNGHLDSGDSFWMRSAADYELVRPRFPIDTAAVVHQMPDLAYGMLSLPFAAGLLQPPPPPPPPGDTNATTAAGVQAGRVLGLIVPCSWFPTGKPPLPSSSHSPDAREAREASVGYPPKAWPMVDAMTLPAQRNLSELVELVLGLSTRVKEIRLICFDVSSRDPALVNLVKSIVDWRRRDQRPDSTNATVTIPPLTLKRTTVWTEMIRQFADLDLIVAGRLHSVILASLMQKPFVAIYAARKIEHLKDELGGLDDQFIAFPIDPSTHLPTSLRSADVLTAVDRTMTNAAHLVTRLGQINLQMQTRFEQFATDFQVHLQSVTRRLGPPRPLFQRQRDSLLDACLAFVDKHAWCLQLNQDGVLQPIKAVHKTLYGAGAGASSSASAEAVDGSTVAVQVGSTAAVVGQEAIVLGMSCLQITTNASGSRGSGSSTSCTSTSTSTISSALVPPIAAAASSTTAVSSIKQEVVDELSYILTGDPWSPFSHGFVRNLYKYPLRQQCEWIVNGHYQTHKVCKVTDRLNVVNIAFQGQHRSGWSMVLEHILTTSFQLEHPLTLDTYVDKTFHWARSFYASNGTIAYQQRWVGVLHHTCYTKEKYNCVELFRNTHFLQSLTWCKGLVVLSQYLHDQIRSLLDCNGHDRIPLHVLMHPTEVPSLQFSWERFERNPQPMVLHVGYWLRRFRSIYELQLLPGAPVQTKAILRPPSQSDERFRDLWQDWRSSVVPRLQGTEHLDRQTADLASFAKAIRSTVKLIEFVPNDAYDELLAQNVVFIHLADASAVNTVIECVVRATPILVNPLPSVIEMIGPDYPLYFASIAEAEVKLADRSLLKQAHEYLLRKKEQEQEDSRYNPAQFMRRMACILEGAAAS